MREAPLGQDAAAAGDDAGHALSRLRNKAQQHACVNREVIHALLALFDQRVAIDLPAQLLGLAVDLLQGLVDRHRADRNRRIANDPFPRRVNVLPGRQIHHGVRAPLGRPAHLLDLFFNAGRHRGVADVGVDLHEEVAPNDHRLALRMVDVRRNDRPPPGHFIAHEFGRDLLRYRRPERVARMLLQKRIARRIRPDLLLQRLQALVLADGNVFHLRRHDALLRIPQLRDRMSLARAQRLADQARVLHQAISRRLGLGCALHMNLRQIAVILGLHRPALVFLHIAALKDPIAPQRRQALLHVALERRIAPRAAAVVYAHRLVDLDLAIEALGVAQFNLPHRHSDIVTGLARDIDALGVGQGLVALGLEGFLGCNHSLIRRRSGVQAGEKEEASLPYASITWIRFQWVNRAPARKSQPSPSQTEPVGYPSTIEGCWPGSEVSRSALQITRQRATTIALQDSNPEDSPAAESAS